MRNDEQTHFVDVVAAATYANSGVIACLIAGVEPTMENAVPVVARWLNPENPHADSMILKIEAHRARIVEAAKSLKLDVRKVTR